MTRTPALKILYDDFGVYRCSLNSKQNIYCLGRNVRKVSVKPRACRQIIDAEQRARLFRLGGIIHRFVRDPLSLKVDVPFLMGFNSMGSGKNNTICSGMSEDRIVHVLCVLHLDDKLGLDSTI